MISASSFVWPRGGVDFVLRATNGETTVTLFEGKIGQLSEPGGGDCNCELAVGLHCSHDGCQNQCPHCGRHSAKKK